MHGKKKVQFLHGGCQCAATESADNRLAFSLPHAMRRSVHADLLCSRVARAAHRPIRMCARMPNADLQPPLLVSVFNSASTEILQNNVQVYATTTDIKYFFLI